MAVNCCRAPGATEVSSLATLLSVPHELETGAERMIYVCGSETPPELEAPEFPPPPPRRFPPGRTASGIAIRPPPMPPARLTVLPEDDCRCGMPEPEPTVPVPRPSSSRR